MAKTGQENISEAIRESDRDANSGVRDFRQAGRDADEASRRLQAGTAVFLSGMMTRPYVDLLRQTEGMTRQWTQGVRTSLEQTLDIASKMNETAISEMKRTADFFIQACETGLSMHRSMVQEAESVTNRQTQSPRAQAAD